MTVIAAVAGALGAIATDLKKYVTLIYIDRKVENAQETAALGTVKILRLALGCQGKCYKYNCARLFKTFVQF